MSRKRWFLAYVAVTMAVIVGCGVAVEKIQQAKWGIHDMSRPVPSVVTPPQPSCDEHVGTAPSDAIVLFDGSDLSEWVTAKGKPAKWNLENGYMEVKPKTGDIFTKKKFGSCQLHIEWASPEQVKGNGQSRGNSGVFLMGLYEIQVLDSYSNRTYADGQAAAVYGQNPPLVNACRPPGKWQSYDIIFHRPIFDKDGKVIRPATVTVLHNGVLVQDNFQIKGPTRHKTVPQYRPHPDKMPLKLQDHGSPVRYRNIWLREIAD